MRLSIHKPATSTWTCPTQLVCHTPSQRLSSTSLRFWPKRIVDTTHGKLAHRLGSLIRFAFACGDSLTTSFIGKYSIASIACSREGGAKPVGVISSTIARSGPPCSKTTNRLTVVSTCWPRRVLGEGYVAHAWLIQLCE